MKAPFYAKISLCQEYICQKLLKSMFHQFNDRSCRHEAAAVASHDIRKS